MRQHGEDGCSALPHRILAKLSKNIRLRNILLFAGIHDVVDNFPDHILIVKLETQGIADRHPTTDIDGVKIFAFFTNIAVELDGLFELPPIIERIPNACIYKKMQHT